MTRTLNFELSTSSPRTLHELFTSCSRSLHDLPIVQASSTLRPKTELFENDIHNKTASSYLPFTAEQFIANGNGNKFVSCIHVKKEVTKIVLSRKNKKCHDVNVLLRCYKVNSKGQVKVNHLRCHTLHLNRPAPVWVHCAFSWQVWEPLVHRSPGLQPVYPSPMKPGLHGPHRKPPCK